MPGSGIFIQRKPRIVVGPEAISPPLGGVQLPVEQAAQEIGKSLLKRIGTVPEHSSLQFFHISWIFEKNCCCRAGSEENSHCCPAKQACRQRSWWLWRYWAMDWAEPEPEAAVRPRPPTSERFQRVERRYQCTMTSHMI